MPDGLSLLRNIVDYRAMLRHQSPILVVGIHYFVVSSEMLMDAWRRRTVLAIALAQVAENSAQLPTETRRLVTVLGVNELTIHNPGLKLLGQN